MITSSKFRHKLSVTASVISMGVGFTHVGFCGYVFKLNYVV